MQPSTDLKFGSSGNYIAKFRVSVNVQVENVIRFNSRVSCLCEGGRITNMNADGNTEQALCQDMTLAAESLNTRVIQVMLQTFCL